MGAAKKKTMGEERRLLGMEIFPPMSSLRLPEAIRCERLREEVIRDIEKNPAMLEKYRLMEPEDREMLMEFFLGNRGLNVLYDPFFKKIMNRERLESFLSQVMDQTVEIVEFLPLEMMRQSAEGSVMIMDMVVKLADGSYVDLEIQRISVEFPFERAVCYASDLVVKQYEQLKMELKQDAESKVKFDYRNIRPIYVIVVMNSSTEKYRKFEGSYIHKTFDYVTFDTGLKEKAIQKFIFISLDNFRKLRDNGSKGKMTELEAWMYFLASYRTEDISRLVEEYPQFVELYQEINQFRRKPEEMMGMISEAIRMLDEGDAKLQIEKLHDQVDQYKNELKEKDNALKAKDNILAQKDELIEALKNQLEALKRGS